MNLALRYRVQAERDYRRAVEDFDRLKALRQEMPNEPNVGLEPPEPEDIQPIEELNWELPHIRHEQQKQQQKQQQKKANEAVPNEANEAVPNEPNTAPDSAIPQLLTSSTPSTSSPVATPLPLPAGRGISPDGQGV